MASAHFDAHEEEANPQAVWRDVDSGARKAAVRGLGLAKDQHNVKTAQAAIVIGTGNPAFGCNYYASSEHASPQCACPPTSLHCSYCDKEGHVEAVCFSKHPERRNLKLFKAADVSEPAMGMQAGATAPEDRAVAKAAKRARQKAKALEVNTAEAAKSAALVTELESLKAQVKTLTVSMAAKAVDLNASTSNAAVARRYGLPYEALMAVEDNPTHSRAKRWQEYREQLTSEEVLWHAEVQAATRRHAGSRETGSLPPQPVGWTGAPITRARGATAAIPLSFKPMTVEQEAALSGGSTSAELRQAGEVSLPSTSGGTPTRSIIGSDGELSDGASAIPAPGTAHTSVVGASPDSGRDTPSTSSVSGIEAGMADVGAEASLMHLTPGQLLQQGALPVAVSAATVAPEPPEEECQSPPLVAIPPEEECQPPPLVAIKKNCREVQPWPSWPMLSAAAQLQHDGGGTVDVAHDSVTAVLMLEKPVCSTILHRLSKGLPVIPPSERMLVNLGGVLVDNRQGAVVINGETPRVALLDTGAQPVILGSAFAHKLGLVGSTLRDSAWRIRTARGKVEPVQGETAHFLSIVFNPATSQAMELKVRCLVPSATSYDILMGQEVLFPTGVTIDNWTEQAYYRVD